MRTEQQQADETAIRAMIDRWNRAVEAKDVAGIAAAYTPKTVLYDAIPPGRTVGGEAIGAIWAQCFPYFPDRFRSEHKDLVVEVDGDVAFAHGLHHFVPEEKGHPIGSTWMRVTACYRRVDGAWTVAHEHVSVPFDPMSGKAVHLDGNAAQSGLAEPCGPAAEAATANGVHKVTPHLVCAGAADAIDFYKRAFDAVELIRMPGPDGKLMHGCVAINGSTVMLCDEYPEMGNSAPTSLKGTPVTIHLPVADVDAAAAKAVAAGARVVMPVADMFWGDRYGIVEDPFGHRWSIATPKVALSEAELRDAAKAAMADMQACGPGH